MFYIFCSKQNANLKYEGRISGADKIKRVLKDSLNYLQRNVQQVSAINRIRLKF